jgi:hypothetical protein
VPTGTAAAQVNGLHQAVVETIAKRTSGAHVASVGSVGQQARRMRCGNPPQIVGGVIREAGIKV